MPCPSAIISKKAHPRCKGAKLKRAALLFLRPVTADRSYRLRKAVIESAQKYIHFVTLTLYTPLQNSIHEIGFSYTAYRHTIHHATFALFVILLLTLLGSGIFLTFAHYWWQRPLQQLEHALEDVSNGQLHSSLRIMQNDEIGNLAQTFTKMLQYLREAHTRIQSYAVSLENKKDLPQPYMNLSDTDYESKTEAVAR